jgi:serine phosphatase RsbU (regulator of sigma subunit)
MELLQASKLLNSTLESPVLLRHILDTARKLSCADRSTLYLVDDEGTGVVAQVMSGPEIASFRMPLGTGVAGHVIQTGIPSRVRDAYRSPHFNRQLDQMTGYRTRSLLTVPFHGRSGEIIGAIQAINHLKREQFGADEQLILESLGEYAALALENARTVEALQQKRRMEEDLVAAARVQHNLLPHELPVVSGLEVAAIYVPCQAVGGDVYDFVTLPNAELGFALGDVCGKGLTAAMMMANLQAVFRLEARRCSAPHEVLASMNQQFYESTEAHEFATFVYGIVEPRSGRVRFSSAGHDPMIIVERDGSLHDAPMDGPPLGMFPQSKYSTHEFRLEPGGVCVVYSDGITESVDGGGEFYGRERLQSILQEARGESGATMVERVRQAVAKFTGGTKNNDDFTLVAVRRGG